MFITKTIIRKLETEELENIKCDICGRNLIKKKDDDDDVTVATLRFSKTTVREAKEKGFEDPNECESSDFCEQCYQKVIELIKKLGGKVPSYYYSEEQSVDQVLQELLL